MAVLGKDNRISKLIFSAVLFGVFAMSFGPSLYAQLSGLSSDGFGYGYGYGYGSGYGSGAVSGVSYKHVFNTKLLPQNEVPPSSAAMEGNASFNVRQDERTIDFSLNVFGSGSIVAAHLHCAPVGQNGPVVVALFNGGGTAPSGGLASGSLTEGDLLPAGLTCSPNIQTMPHLVQAMREGKIYVNVHTTEFPGGAIRGQLGSHDFTPTPTPISTPMHHPHSPSPAPAPAPASGSQYLTLSSYYRLPGETFSVSGFNFPPHSTATVEFNGSTHTYPTNGSGQFFSGEMLVPFSLQNSTVHIAASSAAVTAHAMLHVGTFHPFVTAQNYLVSAGGNATFEGKQFAPGEPVQVRLGGMLVATTAADGGGNFMVSAGVPGSGTAATYSFTGQWSGLTATSEITIWP